MKKTIIKTCLIFGLIFILVSTTVSPGNIENSHNNIQSDGKNALFSLKVYGKTDMDTKEAILSSNDATQIFEMLQELKSEITQYPFSEKTQTLKRAFVALLYEKNLIPDEASKETYLSLLNPLWVQQIQKKENKAPLPQPFANRGTCALCSLASGGSGILLPLFLLPRPRIAMLWLGNSETTAANLLTSRGYVAEGAQAGFALGFIGIGISYALPGHTIYGFIGYALLASTTAASVAHYPPNRAPTISDVTPIDGQQNVPLSLKELQFRIQDADGNLMSYTVTTEPDIGSASGNLKPFGVYTVPVSGLQERTNYSWHILVTDGKDTTEKTFTFTTESIAPVISNPLPADGERDVPMDLPQLQFTLKDYQGDPMEYTVETSPNIGSKHETGVHDGTYTVSVSGLTYGATYRWFINVTDGTHWTRKVFSFETGYPSQFNPFEFGWQYKKQITIDHTQVAEDLENFPILISTIDPDLIKAQDDGGDILFMNGSGVAKRQYHEMELFDKTSGNLVAWVNTPMVSSSQDTVFYMYYGNPTCINQQNPEKTWNFHYDAVWHLNNNPIGTIVDSTVNSNDGTSHGGMTISDLVEGKTGKCLEFDGVDDYISIPDSVSLKPIDLTLIAWYQPQEAAPLDGDFLTKQCYDYWGNSAGNTYSLGVNNPGNVIRGYFETDTYVQCDKIGSHPVVINTWSYLALTFHKATKEGNFYINGVLNGTKNPCDNTVLWYNNPWDFIMGANRYGTGSSQVINRFYYCGLDEIRVLNTPLSAGWISTEYSNQNDPSGFFTIGPEEPGP